jgi:small subunit ribosomal protein S21
MPGGALWQGIQRRHPRSRESMLAASIGAPVRKYRPPRLATASPWQGWRPLFRRQNSAPNAWADFADGRLTLPLRLCLPPYPAEIPSPFTHAAADATLPVPCQRVRVLLGQGFTPRSKGDCFVVKLTLRDKETAQEAVRRFRKLVERSGIKKEIRVREFYEKPSETRRRARLRAQRRARRDRLMGPAL